MGFRFRKSFKIAPGVKLNVNKKSVGISVGGKGARVSVNSKGKVTKSVGIPGTGISYTDTHTIGKNNKAKATTQNNMPIQPSINNNFNNIQPNNPKKPKGKLFYFLLRLLFVLMIFIGLVMTIAEIVVGFIFTAIGCAGIHYCAKVKGDTKPFYKKRWQIVVSIIFILFSIINFTSYKNVFKFNLQTDLSTALQVPNTQEITLQYIPTDAEDVDSIACFVKDTDIADLEVKSIENGKIICELTPKAKGKTSIECTASNFETSFDFEVSTSELEAKEAAEKAEQERLEAEKKAEEERLAAEKAEQERLAAEKAEQERLAAEKAEQERIAQEQAALQAQQERQVYITPTGKKYHYSASCAGDNARKVGISQIGSLEPCKKCAGG